MKADKFDDESHDCKVVEEQREEPGPAPKDEDDSIASALQEVIADDVRPKSQMRWRLSWNLLQRLLSSSSEPPPFVLKEKSILWCKKT